MVNGVVANGRMHKPGAVFAPRLRQYPLSVSSSLFRGGFLMVAIRYNVSRVDIVMRTGSQSTDANVLLGIGALEFNLDNSGNDFESGDENRFTLTEGTRALHYPRAREGDRPHNANSWNEILNNITSGPVGWWRNIAHRGDRTADFRPTLGSIQDFRDYGLYLRLEGGNAWDLQSATVVVTAVSEFNSNDTQKCEYSLATNGPVRLGAGGSGDLVKLRFTKYIN